MSFVRPEQCLLSLHPTNQSIVRILNAVKVSYFSGYSGELCCFWELVGESFQKHIQVVLNFSLIECFDSELFQQHFYREDESLRRHCCGGEILVDIRQPEQMSQLKFYGGAGRGEK